MGSKVIFSDIKPENILFDKRGPNAIAKIADFGVSRTVKKGKKMHKPVGTVILIGFSVT
jgi:Serine/threonine protein kinase